MATRRARRRRSVRARHPRHALSALTENNEITPVFIDSDYSHSDASLESGQQDYVTNAAMQEADLQALNLDTSPDGQSEEIDTVERNTTHDTGLQCSEEARNFLRPVFSVLPFAVDSDSDDEDQFPDDTSGDDDEEGDGGSSVEDDDDAMRQDDMDNENSNSGEATEDTYPSTRYLRHGANLAKEYLAVNELAEKIIQCVEGSRHSPGSRTLWLPLISPRCTIAAFIASAIAGGTAEISFQEGAPGVLIAFVSGSTHVDDQDMEDMREEIDLGLNEVLADRFPGDCSIGSVEGTIRSRCEDMLDLYARETQSNTILDLLFPKNRVRFVLEHAATVLSFTTLSPQSDARDEQTEGILRVVAKNENRLTRGQMADILEIMVQVHSWTRMDRSSGVRRNIRDQHGFPGKLGSEESLARRAALTALEMYERPSVELRNELNTQIRSLGRQGQSVMTTVTGILGLQYEAQASKTSPGTPNSGVIAATDSVIRSSHSALRKLLENALREQFPPTADKRIHVDSLSKRGSNGKGPQRLGARFEKLAADMVEFLVTNPTRDESLHLAKCHIQICRALVRVAGSAKCTARIFGKGRQSYVIVYGREDEQGAFTRSELEQFVAITRTEIFGKSTEVSKSPRQRAEAKRGKRRSRVPKAKTKNKPTSEGRNPSSSGGRSLPSTVTTRGRDALARGVKHAQPIDSSNRGHQLLSKLGWRVGDGLGADQTGRTVPVQPTFNAGRRGLG